MFITPNQKALTIAKILVDKWFYVYGIPTHEYIVTKAGPLIIKSLQHLYALYSVEQSTTMPYNLRGNAQCKQFNRTMIGLLTSSIKGVER